MTQAQFTVLDTLICAQIGIADYHSLAIIAALAMGIAQALGGLTASAQLQTLALQVWG
jgi:hypothetical protein